MTEHTQELHMTLLDTSITIGQLVAERPSRSRIFERHGIDYCCGGKKPLAVVLQEKGLPADVLLQELAAHDASTPAAEQDWNTAPLSELARHIVDTHHAYLKAELPRLNFMVDKVANVHGRNFPWMVQVAEVFVAFRAELESHMMKEERILFPMIEQLEQASYRPNFHCGSVNNPISVMEDEHAHAGDALERMRELTNGYQAPPEACNTFRALLDGLAELEADMHQHVHKENNILFPRAARLEAELR